MSFQSNDSFDQFHWKNKVLGREAETGTEIILTDNGDLVVATLDSNDTARRYKPDSPAIPDFLLDLVFSQMLQSGHNKIIVDTMTADGRTVEVVISRTEDATPAHISAGHELKVDFVDDQRASQEVYLDAQGRILQMHGNHTHLFERTSEENILRQFPERAHYILQKNDLLLPEEP